ncbi:hypothetical protein [Dactylosporangium sp. NPDC000521]|uniref:hypothetical protein n=1 Tax=Dactylosporangium sp. NPDC000521 TaxID=3363975 RepID=UPI0036A3DA60
MPSDDEGLYKPYGLAECPYSNRVLNPFDDPEHAKLYSELDGFVDMRQIEAKLDEAVRTRRAAFFLVSGEGYSGRTSLANIIMFRYWQLLKLKDALPVYRAGNLDNDHEKTLRDTVLGLRWEMLLNSSATTDAKLDGLFDRIERTEHPDPGLQQAAATLAGRFSPYGVCYEKVPSKQLLTGAIELFRKARAVVVFTREAYDHSMTFELTAADRQLFNRSGMVIDLSGLTPRQVKLLAEERWTGEAPYPFSPEGIEASFAPVYQTVGRQLRYLELLLCRRLIDYDSDERWPGPPGLFLDHDFLVREVPFLRRVMDGW